MSAATRSELDRIIQEVAARREKDILGDSRSANAVKVGYCIHPISKTTIPIFAADYVLDDYGTGAVMGVPAHDARDRSLAQQHSVAGRSAIDEEGKKVLETGGICEKNVSFERFRKLLVEQSAAVRPHKTHMLRDWLISRQRYWGVPIPVVHCSTCGVVPVAEEHLPVQLPSTEAPLRLDFGQPKKIPLLEQESFRSCRCPKCSGPASREVDTMDTFVDSSWYFLRFLDPSNPEKVASRLTRDLLQRADGLHAHQGLHRRHRARNQAPPLRPVHP